MAADKDKKDEKVEVPLSLLTKLQEDLAEMERQREEDRAKMTGLEEMFAKNAEAGGEAKLREKKTFEPKFRTVRLRKYAVAGDITDQDIVVGWTNRGAYQEVDRSGVSPQIVDFIDVVFLRNQNPKDGKIKAEKIKLLDLMNNGSQVHCKIIKSERNDRKHETGEEIDITVFDPAHGLVSTGEKIDGYVTKSDIVLTVQVPGIETPVVIDAMYANN